MTHNAGNADALRSHKAESLKKTRHELELAVRRIINENPKRVKKGTSLSPASVAKEADVERSTLYRYHEPVLTEIRRMNDATPQKKLREKHSELADANVKAKEYRIMLEEEQANLAQMARQNYALNLRIKEMEGMLRDRDLLIAELQRGNLKVIPVGKK
ncbi:hypothetical protein [Methylobacter tundripaludum]|uniref:Uncharacterized protein n=1 Tax=Methylobacter tundripaludum (strain ATCC BAA-1195 / DSM 17260 / SV96) TaxID=697282 RepID=G3IUI1_METTV|nr:hypothetical protein [Methylobacter tundripaludum]EGW21591.1 hypothetical protein Mettu_0359 [Methylobacter tundripaludum SV96]